MGDRVRSVHFRLASPVRYGAYNCGAALYQEARLFGSAVVSLTTPIEAKHRLFTTLPRVETYDCFFRQEGDDEISTLILETEVAGLTRELNEARAQQAATAEVLKIISSLRGELTPVFDKILSYVLRSSSHSSGSPALRKPSKTIGSAGIVSAKNLIVS